MKDKLTLGLMSGDVWKVKPSILVEGTVKWGFDLTDFGSKWKTFKKALNLKESGKEGSKGFLWTNDSGLRIITANNPDTGEYYIEGRREPEKGYASYIGIEGPEDVVARAVEAVKKYGDYKDESKGKREYI